MNKAFYLFLRSAVIVLFPVLLSAQSTKLSADYPSTVKQGEEFLMSIRVEKGTASGNARLQMEVPQGFTVKNVNSRGADFVFENNFVKFIWSTLPEANAFTVSCNITPLNTSGGKQTITGEFVYNSGDQFQHSELQPCVIEVTGVSSPMADSKPATPKVDRKIITLSENKSEYRVELTFYPNNVNESAQFTDILPAEYSALVVDAHEALFSFENQSVIFTWKKFPTEKSFTVSYLVRSSSTQPPPVINGTLVYGDAIEGTPEVVSQINAAPEPVHEPAVTESSPQKEDSETPDLAVNTEVNTVEEVPAPAGTMSNGIMFRIQISATKHSSAKDSKWFEENYNVKAPVEMTMDEGWKKYLVGSFGAYEDASKLKSQTSGKVNDAFIVAYQNGKRIPLSEAIRNKAINQ